MRDNSLAQIDFEGLPIRVVGTQENPEWVAADVCKVLGITDPSKTLQRFKPSEKGTNSIRTPNGGIQEMLTVTEPGLYRLIFKSRKPEAERFQFWVTHEVLPSIRQHGCYPPPRVQVSNTALMEIDPKEFTVQLGKAIHDACFSATQPRFDAIDNRLEDINNRLEKVEQRKRIPDQVRRIHLHVLRNYYAGRCPCCHAVRIVNDAGEKRTNCEFDHFFRVSETSVQKTWAVCEDCNGKLRNSDWKAEKRVKFEAYQQTRVEFERAVRGPMLPGMQ